MAAQQIPASGPHDGALLWTAGAALEAAAAVVIAIHGRGAGADDILQLAGEVDLPGVAWLAPEANDGQWYPQRFLVPSAQNQPWLNSALDVVGQCVQQAQAVGIARDRIILLGFSQGACLALEWAAQHGAGLGGVFGFSGGLIGSEEEVEAHAAGLDGLPVFLGCGDDDAHIPLARVEQTARVFARQRADVTLRVYQGMGHYINQDELDFLQKTIAAL